MKFIVAAALLVCVSGCAANIGEPVPTTKTPAPEASTPDAGKDSTPEIEAAPPIQTPEASTPETSTVDAGQPETSLCSGSLTYCASEGLCMDLSDNYLNCGSCGNDCASGDYESCKAGVCTCGVNAIMCNGKCVNPYMDNNNCGSCGNVCTTSIEISNGNQISCIDQECIPPGGFPTCTCLVTLASTGQLSYDSCSFINDDGNILCQDTTITNVVINLVPYADGCYSESGSDIPCPSGQYLYACYVTAQMTSPQCTALTGEWANYYCCPF